MFHTDYQRLVPTEPAFGQVAILPWDVEIFGFAVGNYLPGDLQVLAEMQDAVREGLHTWARAEQVELVACRVPTSDYRWLALLPGLEFTFVDYEMTVSLPRLQAMKLPRTRMPVRLAAPDDQEAIEHIAETSFNAGRYHADARFPRHLANRRYRRWMHHALMQEEPGAQVYVIGERGAVRGFLHVVVRDQGADLRLGAVDRQSSGIPGLGFNLYIGTIAALQQAGVRQVVTRISPSNTAVMNIYGAIEVRYVQPEAIFHWHAPWATHLERKA